MIHVMITLQSAKLSLLKIKKYPPAIYFIKVNNGTQEQICSKLTMKTPERRLLMPLLIALNRLFALFCRFYCWIWKSKRRPSKELLLYKTMIKMKIQPYSAASCNGVLSLWSRSSKRAPRFINSANESTALYLAA